MGRCSATEIMDAAVKAALEIPIDQGCNCYPPERGTTEAARQDNALRPLVRAVAKALHDGDWDCIEESEYFDRFQQEMLDYDDQEYLAYLVVIVEHVKDAADYQSGDLEKWTAKLAEHKRKMGN